MKLLDLTRNGQPVTDVATVEAVSTYLMQTNPFSENTLFMARNEPAVVIGKYQDAYVEVDLDYLRAHHIKLMRRAAGGGAVYTDLGNLVYMFHVVEPQDQHYWLDFKHYAKPLVTTLTNLGIDDVGVSGRNDVTIKGKKISGMAAFQQKNRFSLGGTVLFDVDTETAGKVLTPLRSKYASKGLSSVGSRIMDIKQALPATKKALQAQDFIDRWLKTIFNVSTVTAIPTVQLSDTDWAAIDQLVADRYGNDDWNYGSHAHFDRYVSHHFKRGTVAFNYDVADGQLAHFTVYGDFFTGVQDISSKEVGLIGTKMESEALKEAFENSGFGMVIPWLLPADFAAMLLNPEKYDVVEKR